MTKAAETDTDKKPEQTATEYRTALAETYREKLARVEQMAAQARFDLANSQDAAEQAKARLQTHAAMADLLRGLVAEIEREG